MQHSIYYEYIIKYDHNIAYQTYSREKIINFEDGQGKFCYID